MTTQSFPSRVCSGCGNHLTSDRDHCALSWCPLVGQTFCESPAQAVPVGASVGTVPGVSVLTYWAALALGLSLEHYAAAACLKATCQSLTALSGSVRSSYLGDAERLYLSASRQAVASADMAIRAGCLLHLVPS